ncbi:MAG: hypothetical protein WD226_00880 [Planctomycetota bacterium]
MQALLTLLFWWTVLLVAGALTVAYFHRLRVRATLGSVLVVFQDRRPRRVALLVYLVLAFLGCLQLGEFGRDSFFAAGAVSVVGALALVLLPTRNEGWIGTRGVRLGWLVRPWASIGSWRLVGQHLRFFVDERWCAIPVDEAEREQLRGALREVIPALESTRT